jgi:hypothetical protein
VANVVVDDVLYGTSVLLTLSDTAQVTTLVHLPPTTRRVNLRAFDAAVWYALDQAPTIPPRLMTTAVPAAAFVLGDVVLANEVMGVALPDDALLHDLYLVSDQASPTIIVTALVEDPHL